MANSTSRLSEAVQKAIQTVKETEDFFQKAKLLRHLVDVEDVRITQISELLSMKASYVCHILRLNRVPEIMIDGYYSDLISISHLFVLSRIKDQDEMMRAYERVLGEGLTVQQTDQLVREVLYGVLTEGKRISSDLFEIFKNTLKEDYKNVDIKLIQTRVKGSLTFEVRGSLDRTSTVLKGIISRLNSDKVEG